jgi:hypothetical protein
MGQFLFGIEFRNVATCGSKNDPHLRIVGDGVQLDPLSISVTNRPIVPVPCDCDDGEFGGIMIDRGNRGTRRKPAPVPLCPP